jgi:hypothetical protein
MIVTLLDFSRKPELRIEKITEDAEYEGIRVQFVGELDSAVAHMQIDIRSAAPSELASHTVFSSGIACSSKASPRAYRSNSSISVGSDMPRT